MNIWLDDVKMPENDPDYISDADRVVDYIWVKNIEELKELLARTKDKINVMSFDYDLGPRQPSGLDAITMLHREYRDRYPRKIRAHSMHPKASAIRRFGERVREKQTT